MSIGCYVLTLLYTGMPRPFEGRRSTDHRHPLSHPHDPNYALDKGIRVAHPGVDRPTPEASGPEDIEVTEAMLKAGRLAIAEWDSRFEEWDGLAESVYVAMERARRAIVENFGIC